MSTIPDNLKYTNEHEWVRMDGNIAYIGITEFAQGELGDIVFVDVDTVGEDLAENEVFGSVEAVKTVSDLYLPISGKVEEFNEKLEANPELINTSPYEDGWIIKLLPTELSQLDSLMDADQYSQLIGG